jgi:hypothetical protein
LETISEAMLTQRSDPGPDADLLEPTYQASVRRYNARRQLVNRARWYGFHMSMSELHARLSAEHAAKAERLCTEDGQ